MVAFETLVFADDRDVLGLIDVDKSASHHLSQTEIDGDNPCSQHLSESHCPVTAFTRHLTKATAMFTLFA